MERPSFPPYLALLIGVIAVSTSAIFVKLATAPPAIIATYRLIFSVLLTLPFLLFTKGVFAEFKRLRLKEWAFGLLSGAFLASHFVLWFESLNYTSVASSTVLVTLQPLFAFIGGYFFFKERVNAMGIIGGMLAIGGSFVIGWGDFRVGGTALFGDILALLGALTVTAYWLIGQYIRRDVSMLTYTLMVYSTSSLFLLLYDALMGFPLHGYPRSDWGWFFCLALIPTLLGHTIFNWVIKWLNTSTISMSILGEPVGTSILAYFILDEKVTIPQYVGGAIILAGIYLFIRFNSNSKGDSSDEPATTEA